MKRLLIAFMMAALPALGFAAGGAVELDEARVDLTDTASLQRGAKYFVNYCLSCHSASYMRYNRVAKDLDLSEDLVRENLIFTGAKVGDVMNIAMPAQDARQWFGTAVPDLSVIARARGADWLYTYLRSFYLDESRPFGVNNLVFPDVGMPHVLWELQGWQAPVYKTETGPDGESHKVIERLEVAQPGKLTPVEYDRAMHDLVNFLAYMGEPAKLDRQRLGVWVLLFLVGFFALAYLLKKEYWKDVH